MLAYLPTYGVLVCLEHQRALYGADEHLKRHHKLPLRERRALLDPYSSLALLSPTQVPLPEPYSAPLAELGTPKEALICCCCCDETSRGRGSSTTSSSSSSSSSSVQLRRVCGFITTSCSWMKQHVNQQHQIKQNRWPTTAAATSLST